MFSLSLIWWDWLKESPTPTQQQLHVQIHGHNCPLFTDNFTAMNLVGNIEDAMQCYVSNVTYFQKYKRSSRRIYREVHLFLRDNVSWKRKVKSMKRLSYFVRGHTALILVIKVAKLSSAALIWAADVKKRNRGSLKVCLQSCSLLFRGYTITVVEPAAMAWSKIWQKKKKLFWQGGTFCVHHSDVYLDETIE